MPDRQSILALRIYPLAIPLRKPFEHAAHARQTADPVVVEVELADGTLGYGETLARPYVTGETPEGVVQTILHTMPEYLVAFRPSLFAEAFEAIDALPIRDANGAIIAAARAAVELALLDAYSRSFRRPISNVVGWLGTSDLGPPGSLTSVTYSGILSGRTASLKRKARMMWWYGLRDFKLKVGYEDDADRVTAVVGVLGGALRRGQATLRIDANAAWTLEQATAQLRAMPLDLIACVEQPLTPLDDNLLPALKQALGGIPGIGIPGRWATEGAHAVAVDSAPRVDSADRVDSVDRVNSARSTLRIMPDESLITMDDGERLVGMGAADVFNIRISKNGGLLPALRLAHYARQHELAYQLGCMVGETSILSAAGRRFIECVPGVRFAEGSYGRFLLAGDIIDRPVQFGCRGRVTPLPDPGWGITVNPALLRQHCHCGPTEIRL